MEMEDDKKKDYELARTGITNEEYNELKHELNPESIRKVLLKREYNIK